MSDEKKPYIEEQIRPLSDIRLREKAIMKNTRITSTTLRLRDPSLVNQRNLATIPRTSGPSGWKLTKLLAGE